MRSLRGALILGTSIGAVVVFSAAGVLLYFLLRAKLVHQIDRALEEKVQLMTANIETRGPKLKLELNWATNQGRDALAERDYFALWDSNGMVVYCSPQLLDSHMPPFGNSLGQPKDIRWLSLGDGVDRRAVGVRFQPEKSDEPDEENETNSATASGATENAASTWLKDMVKDPTLTLVLVRDATSLNATLAYMKIILLVVGCGAAAISSAAGMIVIGRSLRPLEKLQHDISVLDAGDLAARIHVPKLPQELLPLVTRLNDLLGRLETAFQRERGFSADIAHELRTPLAGLRTTIEVTLARSRQPIEYQDALYDCQQIAVQLQSLVENLLSLVQLESGEQEVQFQTLSVSPFLQEQWNSFAGIAEQRELTIEWLLGTELQLRADVGYLSIAVQNLFANAVEYANPGGWIKVVSSSTTDRVVITVANSGSRISQADVEKVFDRFWRGDKARSDVGRHFGLGLALVQRIIAALGGAIRAQSDAGGVFSVSLLLPARGAIPTASRPVLADAL